MLLDLFLSFLEIGLMSIGGGYAAMPLIQAQAVAKHGWLTMGEFADLVTIAEMTPGPIGINAATFVGVRLSGIPGAMVATLGFLLPSMIIVSLLAFLYTRYKTLPALQSILKCLKPVVAALILSAGLKLLLQVVFGEGEIALQNVDVFGLVLFSAALLILRKWKPNPILVLVVCGGLGLLAGVVGIL